MDDRFSEPFPNLMVNCYPKVSGIPTIKSVVVVHLK
jgi:hypothetical protein